jgi:phosphoenolpyruvate carboxylase
MKDKIMKEYQKQVTILAPLINDMSQYVPSKRKRKLHIGLFGYSRKTAGIKLPRAIKFCAALYSFGLPPEILGLNVLSEKDIDGIRNVYKNFDEDLRDSLKFLNKDNLKFFPIEIRKSVNKIIKLFDFDIDYKHKKITSIILDNYKQKNTMLIQENILRAGFVRGFLG